jgi:serine protease DegQ
MARGTSSIHLESKPVSVQEATGSDAAPSQGSYREAVRRAMPAVVNIFTTKEARPQARQFNNDPFFRRFFGEGPNTQDDKQFSLGSGVIVSSEGYILTNDHVIDGAEEMEVALADGRKIPAKLVGSDPDTDLAVIKVNLKNLPSITLGRLDNAKVGDVVLAIGNPFGVGQTVTMGIISALGRNHLGINTFENFIQTDAAINPGNSGGALVDGEGRLIGINTAIYSRSGGSLGIGFAIPVSTARQVLDQLVRDGVVTRGYIGVEPVDLNEDLISAFRLPSVRAPLIVGVVRGGPADQSGIRRGDILLEIEGRPIASTAAMLDTIARLPPGTQASFKMLRGGREFEFRITIARRPVATR